MHKIVLLGLIAAYLSAAATSDASGEEASRDGQRNLPTKTSDGADVNPFFKSYLSLEIARNYPVSFAQNRYDPGEYHPVLAYRHNLDSDWFMGVGGQFKILRRIDLPDEVEPSRDLALLTLTHEALYVLRLDHPTYLLVGTKLHYFLPALTATLPLTRDDEMTTEIGAGLSTTLARILSGGGLVTLRADRWRGTRSLKLHGVEVALGYSHPLR